MSDISGMDIHTLIDLAGGEPKFRAICDVARTTVLDWKRTGQLPANRIAQISAALNVPLEDLIKLTPQVSRPSSRNKTEEAAA